MRRSGFALAAVWATAACGKAYGDAGGEADASAPVVDAGGPTDQDADAFGTANAGVFVRSSFGQTPVYDATWSASTWTASWYECGVSIP